MQPAEMPSASNASSKWPKVKRLLTLVFFVLVAALIVWQARKIEWAQVAHALQAYRAGALTMAAVLAACSYFIYSCYDLVGCKYLGIQLEPRRAMSIGFISYAFNQNFGSIVGAFAFRFRLYSRFGLDNAQISRVLAMSMLTNWMGYFVIAGAVFALGLVSLPAGWASKWPGGPVLLRIIGSGMLTAVLAYVVLCATAKQRVIRIRGARLHLPPLRMTLTQLALSMTHWPVTATVIYVLLQQRIEFTTVLGTLMLSSVAAVLTHIPAGLGVLEAMFIGLLGYRLPHGQILAALLAFRAFYYLLPLSAAGLLYFGMELEAKKHLKACRHGTAMHEAQSCASN